MILRSAQADGGARDRQRAQLDCVRSNPFVPNTLEHCATMGGKNPASSVASPKKRVLDAHLSRLRLFQRHLRSLVWVSHWVWVWVWEWIHSHTPPRTRSPSSRHPPFTHYPFPLRSLVFGGQPSPHKPRLVVSHSTCPPLSSSPHAHSFVLGTAVINTHTS